jgi:tripartite-type tricarboxylate transporter receptor subunit TctC
MIRITHCLYLLLVTLLCPAPGYSQTFPDKPVRLIVTFPPGGGSDAIARIVGPKAGENLGQQIIIDNRAGAGGLIGTEVAIRSAPDGYTMVLAGPGEVGISRAAYYKLSFDSARDLLPVAKLTSSALALVVHPSLPVANVSQLVELAKRQPGALNYGSPGNTTIPHLTGELFRTLTKTSMVHVAYKGAGPALTDLIAGHIQMMFPTLPAANPHIAARRLKALAVTTSTRAKAQPELPTLTEAGVRDFDVEQWQGVFTPAGVPAEVISRLHAAFSFALRQPDVIAGLTKQGADPAPTTQEQFRAFVRSDIEKWARAVKTSGVKADE